MKHWLGKWMSLPAYKLFVFFMPVLQLFYEGNMPWPSASLWGRRSLDRNLTWAKKWLKISLCSPAASGYLIWEQMGTTTHMLSSWYSESLSITAPIRPAGYVRRSIILRRLWPFCSLKSGRNKTNEWGAEAEQYYLSTNWLVFKDLRICLKGTFRDHSRDNALNFHEIRDFCILVMVLDVWT